MAAHDAGIIHRDIKPANLMFDVESERACVADFGIAQRADRHDPSEALRRAGTSDFSAPEQLAGEGATERSDLYGLGATVHYALTGSSPGDAPRKDLQPRWLGRIVTELLAQDPEQRPASAREVVRRIERKLRSPTRVLAKMAVAPFAILLLLAGLASLTELGITGWTNRALGWVNGDKFFAEGEFGTYKSLWFATRTPHDGAILIDADGKIEVGAVGWERDTPLTIRAAPGRRPILVEDNPEHPMISSKAPLTLEGLTFLGSSDRKGDQPIIRTISAPLTIRRCSILSITRPVAPILVLGGVPNVTIEDCLIYSGDQPWLRRRAAQRGPGLHTTLLSVKDSMIVGRNFEMLGNANLTLEAWIDRSVIFCNRLFRLERQHPIDVAVTESFLGIRGTAIWFDRLPKESRAGGLIRWNGRSNRFGETPPSFGMVRGISPRNQSPATWSGILPSVEETDPTILKISPPERAETLESVRKSLSIWWNQHRSKLAPLDLSQVLSAQD